jgi:hypothetical protein
MKYFNYFILTSLLLFFSCTQEKSEDFLEIMVNPDSEEIINISSFIKGYKLIKIDTQEKSLISNPQKIQYYKGNFYILDTYQNSILMIDNHGNSKRKLSKQGNGPGEYYQITDFVVYHDYLYVLDNSKAIILYYDTTFTFVDKINTETYAKNFAINEHSLWLYNVPKLIKNDHQITQIAMGRNSKKEYLPKNTLQETYGWGGPNVFYTHQNNLYLSPIHDNTIYLLKQSSIEPVFKINFGKNSFPEKDNTNKYNVFEKDFKYALKQNYFITSKYVLFDFFYKLDRFFGIYNKEDSTFLQGKITNDLIKKLRFSPSWGNDNFLIDAIPSDVIYNSFPFLLEHKEIESLKADDNPVIVLYQLK